MGGTTNEFEQGNFEKGNWYTHNTNNIKGSLVLFDGSCRILTQFLTQDLPASFQN